MNPIIRFGLGYYGHAPYGVLTDRNLPGFYRVREFETARALVQWLRENANDYVALIDFVAERQI